jgi:DNA processing protein
MARDILQAGGGLLTEFTTDSKPDRENFPQRNRIVAGMCDATIVVESGRSGGSMITADLANSYSRDVFAVPGRVDDERSSGCNLLIKSNRAFLFEGVHDLRYVMGWEDQSANSKPVQTRIFAELNPEEERVLEYLKEKGRTQIDELSASLQMPVSAMSVCLFNLEINGLIRTLPGKIYELTS